MTDAKLEIKVNLFHDVRNHDANVSQIEKHIKTYLNGGDDLIENVRIAVGRKAGAVFITISPHRRVAHDKISASKPFKRLVQRTVMLLERYDYADNVRKDDVMLGATT